MKHNANMMDKVLLNPIKFTVVIWFSDIACTKALFLPYQKNGSGTQMQARAWTLANASVVDHITQMVTMSDYRQQLFESNMRDRLSVADAVALEHRLGLNNAATFVAAVDPWCFPHDSTPSSLNVKRYVQSIVAQVAHSGRVLSKFTDSSISDFLLSPLLVKKKGDRPPLVLKPRAQQNNPSPKRLSQQPQLSRANRAILLLRFQLKKVRSPLPPPVDLLYFYPPLYSLSPFSKTLDSSTCINSLESSVFAF